MVNVVHVAILSSVACTSYLINLTSLFQQAPSDIYVDSAEIINIRGSQVIWSMPSHVLGLCMDNTGRRLCFIYKTNHRVPQGPDSPR